MTGLVDLVGRWSTSRPDAPALRARGREVSYARLESLANAVADDLLAAGVRTGQAVGVPAERGIDTVVAFLGILKAGAVYVPLDPDDPRLAAMAAAASVRFAIDLPQARIDLPALDRIPMPDHGSDGLPGLRRSAEGSDLAYVLFTSGTAGRPKAVGIRHRGVARLVVDTDYVDLTPADRVLHVSSLSFDASAFEIWGALLNGACAVIADTELLFSPPELRCLFEEEFITTIFLTTAVFHHLASRAPEVFRGLRTVAFGGEIADPALVREVLTHRPPDRLMHVYGPTENTTFTTAHVVRTVPAGASTVPIGRPITGTTCHIVRDDGTPAEPGEPGELLVGGAGVAAGYLNDPERTARSFVADPAGGDSRARLYRTGDIVSRRADGELEFHHRRDNQLKVHGHRIEAGEVECALREHPAVADACVVRQSDRAGDSSLSAFVVTTGGSAMPVSADLRGHLGERLPRYMIPARFVHWELLPLNHHGKVDRAVLSATAIVDEPDEPTENTGSTLLDRIGTIWREVLLARGVGAITPHHTLFGIGGDSFDVLAVHERMTGEFDLPDLSALDLFTYPTLRGYTEHVAKLLAMEV